MHSGGAVGADCSWVEQAALAHHKIQAFSFIGNKINGYVLSLKTSILPFDGRPGKKIDLSEEQLAVANGFVEIANVTLKRKLPQGYSLKLIQRNYYQIKDVERVFAIGYFEPRSKLIKGGVKVTTLIK